MLASRRRLSPALAVIAGMLGAGACLAQDEGTAKWDVTLDLDGDGTPDRASIVDAADGGASDLHVFLGSGGTEPKDGAKPDIVRKAITRGTVLAFESRKTGTLTLTDCTGCSSMSYLDETLTMVYRDGTLMVGGFARGWELSRRRADGNVDVKMGRCSIDYLTGEGRVGRDLDEEKPVKAQFAPIALADWSEKRYPDICKYEGEK